MEITLGLLLGLGVYHLIQIKFGELQEAFNHQSGQLTQLVNHFGAIYNNTQKPAPELANPGAPVAGFQGPEESE